MHKAGYCDLVAAKEMLNIHSNGILRTKKKLLLLGDRFSGVEVPLLLFNIMSH